MKQKFIPNSPHERHQKYFGAFLIEEGLTNPEYLNYITKYIFDSNLSPDNTDDLEFFQNLLFESLKGPVHIDYYDRLLSGWSFNSNINQTIDILVRYSYFLSRVSNMFLQDFFYHILKLDNKQIIIKLFPKLDAYSKIQFIEWSDQYSEVVTLIPKLKMYLLFT